MRKRVVLVALLAAAVVLAAGAGSASKAAASEGAAMTKVTLQLKWVPQAQFAGYYAAQELGYYKAAGLDVKITNGGPNIIPEQVVASRARA
jgi:NitT/TauT family transport system substrate-binding protein